jgi:hypothetical protein
MNHNRFDRLSQNVADPSLHSRRGVLAALGIAVLGALAGVDIDAASATHKSRRSTKRKTRHEAKPRRKDARGRLRATTLASDDIRCEPFTTCQEAACIDETTFRPACTCAKRGSCECPDAVACANHLVCQKGACLITCVDDLDCAKGATCDADGHCTVPPIGPSCDCSNLNSCSGNGSCTPECTCVCHEGWAGAACNELPNPVTCSDHLTCAACSTDTVNGCTFCSTTLDGATDVCVTADQCLVARDGC